MNKFEGNQESSYEGEAFVLWYVYTIVMSRYVYTMVMSQMAECTV